jgi:predicted DsbA family dithiol-disulfide isomerase
MHEIHVEIWSDVVCPFCYIGKRQFEEALHQFKAQRQVKILWRSFQLDPEAKPESGRKALEDLAEKKGWSIAQAWQISAQVTEMAKNVGLDFKMDIAISANSLDAHRLLHFANLKGLQSAAEERLFAAYFSEGKDIGNREVLARLGEDLGVDPEEVAQVLQTNSMVEEVQYDIYQAKQLGITGVPFFVFQNKYGVSGARGTETFLEILNTLHQEYTEIVD